MSLPHILLLNVPPFVLFAAMTTVVIILSVAGTLLFHRFIPHRSLKIHNDIAGPIFSTLGVVYAVLLGFVVVVVWQNFDRAKLNAEIEVNCIASIYVDSEPFEKDFRRNLRGAIGAYTRAVVDEWGMLAIGSHNPQAHTAMERLITLYGSYLPVNEPDKVFFAESVAKLNKLLELRILRLTDARAGVHPLLWFVLIMGAAITIVFTIFFGTDNLRAKLVMTTLLAVLIWLVLFTILEFSLPFTGFATISCESFKGLLLRVGA